MNLVNKAKEVDWFFVGASFFIVLLIWGTAFVGVVVDTFLGWLAIPAMIAWFVFLFVLLLAIAWISDYQKKKGWIN